MSFATDDMRISQHIAFARRTSAGPVYGAWIERGLRRTAEALCAAGSIAGGCTARFVLEESDDQAASVVLADSGVADTLAAPFTALLRARPARKFLRVRHDVAGTAGVVGGAFLLLGNSPVLPDNAVLAGT